jgi:hypothetical protein
MHTHTNLLTNRGGKRRLQRKSAASVERTRPAHFPFVQRKGNVCSCGGACPKCFGAIGVQPKLKIGAANDKYEQEADRVAAQVMRMPDPQLSSSDDNPSLANNTMPGNGTIQRACASCSTEYKTAEAEKRPVEPENLCPKCQSQKQGLIQAKRFTPLNQRQEDFPDLKEEDKELIQTKMSGGSAPEATAVISTGIQSLQGSGRPLSGSERSFFEPRFGVDFSSVRLHNDTRAANTARSINARAFTFGDNVVFGAGEYFSEGASGKKLLAHELTHVIQQNQATVPMVQRYTQAERDTCPCLDWTLTRMWASAQAMVAGGALTGREHASDFMEQFLDEDSSDATVPFSEVQGNQGGREAINVVTNRLINKFVLAGEGLDCDAPTGIRRSASAPGHFSGGTELFYAMGAFTVRATGFATVTKVCTEEECAYIDIEVNISYMIDDLYDWKFEPGGCTPRTGESGCTANTKEVDLPVLGQICDECLNRLVIHDWAAEFMVKVRGRVDDYFDTVDCGDRYADDDVSSRPEER